MAAAVDSRKRFATPFIDDHFCDLAKRGRYATLCTPGQPLDALRDIFPDASPRDLEACFAASGGDIHATAQAYRAQQGQLASRLAQGTADECAGFLMEQMAAAADGSDSDASNRASWVLGLIKNAAAAEVARLREENAALRKQAARLHEEAAALRERAATADRDNKVLKRGVLAVLKEYM
jgi:hypothetical protein